MPTDTKHEHPYADGSRSSRRYSSLLRASVINRLRDASASERIAGILRMRDERRRESGSSTTLDGRRRGMAARLQERFSVRTRRRQGSGLVDRAVTATPDAAIGLSSHAEDGPDRPESTDHTVTPAPVT